MSAPQQWEWLDEPRPRPRLSDAELGDTLFSTKQGRQIILAMLLGVMVFIAAWMKATHTLAAGFAPMALLVALYLYRYHPSLYIGFNWWVWILTPFARRVIEIKSGYVSASPILLAPYLVSLPTALTLVTHAPKLLRRHLFPFALVLFALGYGYIVGIVSTGLAASSYGLLVWVVPPLLGFHIAVQWDIYPALRTLMRRTIVATVFVMGVYGVYQFVRPLPWDIFWIYASRMIVVGLPYPMQFRVFSTMNSPPPFAVVMMASLIVVLSQQSKTAMIALASGATALLLSTVRTAWLAWVIGFLIYAWFVPWRSISRLVVPLVSLAALVGVLIAFTPLGDVITKRFETFTSMSNDVSLNERKDFYAAISDRVMNTPTGTGLGGTGAAATMSQGTALQDFDSGVLDIVFSLGWFGGLVYVIGLSSLAIFALRIGESRGDYFDLALRAAALATLSIVTSFNAMIGVNGIVFWGFLGLCIARHYWIENLEDDERNHARLMALQSTAASIAGAA